MQGIPQIIPAGQASGTVPLQVPTVVALSLGELVRGEVLNILPNAVSMRVKKEIMLAKSDIPLEQGKSYLFQVESMQGNEVRLRVVQALTQETEPAESPIFKLLEGMKGAELSHDQIIAFKKILEKMPESVWKPLPQLFKDVSAMTEGALKESVDSSGGYFETKLRALIVRLAERGDLPGKGDIDQLLQTDLKGNLLKLKEGLLSPELQDLLKEGKVNAGEISETVDKLLAHIEQQQFTSKMNAEFQTFVPFIWQGLKDGKLTFKESSQAHEGEIEHDCVIALDLEEVGRLVSHVRLFEDRLNLRFFTENPKLTALLEENKPLLIKQLNDIGLVCNSLVITEEKVVDFDSAISPFELDVKA